MSKLTKKILVTALALAVSIPILGLSGNTLQAQPSQNKTELIVGIKEARPFVIKLKDGGWDGISIELWRKIAEKQKISYQFRERKLAELITGVQDGSLDLAIAAITITPDREAKIDFSHSYFMTGLGIAVPDKTGGVWFAVAQRFFSLEFLTVLAILIIVLLSAGTLVWLFERKANSEQFGGNAKNGIGAGFWWSAVTMTTVGYGDKSPVTLGGRIVALVWMFAALIIISSFTAAITSALTVSRLSGNVKGLSDLENVHTATVTGSSSAAFLRTQNIGFTEFKTIRDGLQAVQDKNIDAFVYDAPLMQYEIQKNYSGRVSLLPNTFARQSYGIAMPSQSGLREPVNRALLEITRSPDWAIVLKRYFGASKM